MGIRVGVEIRLQRLRVPEARNVVYAWILASQSRGEIVPFVDDFGVIEDDRFHLEGTATRALQWLGVGPLDGLRFTKQVRHDFQRLAEDLIASGHAYRDFQEDLESSLCTNIFSRALAYRSRDRDLSPEESNHRARAGQSHTVRFKVPPGRVSITDVARGRKRLSTDPLEDFLLLLKDGTPTPVVIHTLCFLEARIDHMICLARELNPSADPGTLRLTLLHRALGASELRFVHLPEMERGLLPAVERYKSTGFSADAIVNYLALLGWSSADGREKFGRDELVQSFSFARVVSRRQKLNPDLLLRLDTAHGGRGKDDALIQREARRFRRRRARLERERQARAWERTLQAHADTGNAISSRSRRLFPAQPGRAKRASCQRLRLPHQAGRSKPKPGAGEG